MKLNDGKGLSKYEFLVAVLTHIGKVSQADIDPWLKVYCMIMYLLEIKLIFFWSKTRNLMNMTTNIMEY